MTRVVITADHAELVSRKIAAAGAARVRRKAVNEAGKSARKELPGLIAEVYATSRAGVGPRGKAAAPGAEDPRYTLTLRRKIPLSKLKASARKFKAKGRGAERLGLVAIKQGPSGTDRFRARKGAGRGEFILPSRAGRRERRLGGVPISLQKDSRISARRDQIAKDLVEALQRNMEAALKGRR